MNWGTVIEGNERSYGSLFKEVPLWMLPVQRVELALKSKAAQLDRMKREYSSTFFDSVKAGRYRNLLYIESPFPDRLTVNEWKKTRRQYRIIVLAIGMLDRELTYRREPQYREFCRALQNSPKNATIKVAFADWCEEHVKRYDTIAENYVNSGLLVMARRLRAEGSKRDPATKMKMRRTYR